MRSFTSLNTVPCLIQPEDIQKHRVGLVGGFTGFTFINWNSSIRKRGPFSLSCLLSYVTVWVTIQTSYCLFYCTDCSNCGHWELLQCLLCLFDLPCHFLSTVLTFWYHTMPQAHLLYSLSQPCNQSLLQGHLVPFIGELYLETKMWMHIAIGVFLFQGSPRRQTQEIYVCILTHAYTHLSIYLLKNHEFILISSVSI